MDLSDPDGKNQPINDQTLQRIGTVRAYSTAILFAGGNSDWEQAGIVYINGVRQAEQIGNFSRPTLFGIGEKTFNQEIAVAGWHKRGAPSDDLPWTASRGQVQDTNGRWDDSWGDLDFNDFTAELTPLTGTVHPIGE
ncbi:hypothetical protein [Streptomyces griseosporeus]|uniref:hypothetical protein n=1 Tax=Streptomyces griseosporeus TaxID=1910 RepID=UPI00167D9E8C|nr:hypothetical protein [Streptomyces griseosporeus]GHF76254.1 hypothetical protein GCM10018783_53030 [Streptomyces griseosporeus]